MKAELEMRLKEVLAKEEERAEAVKEAEEAKKLARESKSILNEKIVELTTKNLAFIQSQEKIRELSAELEEAKLSHVDEEVAEQRLKRAKEDHQVREFAYQMHKRAKEDHPVRMLNKGLGESRKIVRCDRLT